MSISMRIEGSKFEVCMHRVTKLRTYVLTYNVDLQFRSLRSPLNFDFSRPRSVREKDSIPEK